MMVGHSNLTPPLCPGMVEAKGIQMMAMEMFGSFFASVVHDKVMETSSLYLALFKDHFDV